MDFDETGKTWDSMGGQADVKPVKLDVLGKGK